MFGCSGSVSVNLNILEEQHQPASVERSDDLKQLSVMRRIKTPVALIQRFRAKTNIEEAALERNTHTHAHPNLFVVRQLSYFNWTNKQPLCGPAACVTLAARRRSLAAAAAAGAAIS